jgi:hypothetical protein
MYGDFNATLQEGGISRGTSFANQQVQAAFFRNQRYNLAFNESAWDILTNPDISHPSYEKNLLTAPLIPEGMEADIAPEDLQSEFENSGARTMRKMLEEAVKENEEQSGLYQKAPESVLDGCGPTTDRRLWNQQGP